MKPRNAILVLGAILSLALGADLLRGMRATLSWDYDYAKDPPCEFQQKPAAGTCVVGFNIFLNGIMGRASQRFIANRFDSGRVLDRGLHVTLPVHQYGNVEICVVSLAKDGSGSYVESLPVCGRRRLLPFGLAAK